MITARKHPGVDRHSPLPVHSRTREQALSVGIEGLRHVSRFLASVAVFAMVVSTAASAATAPALGTTSTFGIVSTTFTNNANPTVINGSVCYTIPPATPATTITGAIETPCLPAKGADQGAALADLNGQACVSLGVGAVALNTINLGSGPGVFTPGCYSSGGAMDVAAGVVTLSGPGVYVFRSAGALSTAVGTSVALAGGACAGNVFWTPTGATTLGANTSFVGNILDAAGVTMGSTSTLVGRILAFGGTVTTDSNTITVPAACAPVGGGAASIPTLSEWGMIILAGLVAIIGFMQMRRRARVAY